jgi:hypothetical protein
MTYPADSETVRTNKAALSSLQRQIQHIPGQLDLVEELKKITTPLTAAELAYLNAPADELAQSA